MNQKNGEGNPMSSNVGIGQKGTIHSATARVYDYPKKAAN
jgi:hypothetical protein